MDVRNNSNEAPDPIVAAVEAGVLDKAQVAYFWCLEYYESRHKLPCGKNITIGVYRRYKVEISDAAAYRGLRMLKSTLPVPNNQKAA